MPCQIHSTVKTKRSDNNKPVGQSPSSRSQDVWAGDATVASTRCDDTETPWAAQNSPLENVTGAL